MQNKQAMERPRRAMAGLLSPVPDYAGRVLDTGDKVLARWDKSAVRFPATITALHADNTFDLAFDDGDVELGVPLNTPGVDGPNVRYRDGSTVLMPEGNKVKRQAKPRAARKVRKKTSHMPAVQGNYASAPEGIQGEAMHMGFSNVRVQPPEAGQDRRDGLQHRFTFAYKLRKVGLDGVAVVTEERVSLHDIVNNNDETMRRMHCASLYDFMVQLYTSPPIGYGRMHTLLGEHDPPGSFRLGEHERMQELFARHAAVEIEHRSD